MSRHRRSHIAIDVLLVLAAVNGPAHALMAQAAPPLTPGAHVRVTIPRTLTEPEHHIDGKLARFQGDTVVIDTSRTAAATLVATRLDSGMVVETVSGRRGYAGIGAGLGAVVGVVTAALIASSNDQPCNCWDIGGGDEAFGAALIGMLGGAFTGAIIGGVIQSDTWSRVTPGKVGITVSSRGVGLAIAF